MLIHNIHTHVLWDGRHPQHGDVGCLKKVRGDLQPMMGKIGLEEYYG